MSAGMTREIDQLGRVVVPMEIRRVFQISPGDPLEVFIDEENQRLILKQYTGISCVFCKEVGNNMKLFKGKQLCEKCLSEVSNHMFKPFSNDDLTIDENKVKRSKPFTSRKRTKEMTKQQLIEARKKHADYTYSQLGEILGVTSQYVYVLLRELEKDGLLTG